MAASWLWDTIVGMTLAQCESCQLELSGLGPELAKSWYANVVSWILARLWASFGRPVSSNAHVIYNAGYHSPCQLTADD